MEVQIDRSKVAGATKGKSGLVAIVILIGTLVLSIIMRLRLLHVPLDRDEGEYAYVAQQLLHGVPPFISIYHLKMPGIYAAYAMILFLCGQTTVAIHLGLLLLNAANTLIIYFIGKRIFSPLFGAFAAICFTLYTLSQKQQGYSANTENFVLLAALAGIFLMFRAIDSFGSSNKGISILGFFSAGVTLGISYTMKQTGVFFIGFNCVYLLYRINNMCPEAKTDRRRIAGITFAFLTGTIFPMAVICLVFLHLGLFDKFWWWTWTYPQLYATHQSLSQGLKMLHPGGPNGAWFTFWPMIALGSLGLFRTILDEDRDRRFFLSGLLLFSILSVAAGFNFYPHYFILVAPAISFFVAAGCVHLNLISLNSQFFLKKEVVYASVLMMVLVMVWNERAYLFEMNGKAISRWEYADAPFTEAVDIGNYIRQHSVPSDKIAVIGSEPEIYFYAQRRAATGFIYTYEMMRDHDYAHAFQAGMISEIEKSKPSFIVYVNERCSWYSAPLQHPDSTLFNWCREYIGKDYEPCGLANIYRPEHKQDILCWNDKNKHCEPEFEQWVGVYRRRE